MSEYLEQGGLSLKNCISSCTDWVAADIHCFFHRKALVAKILPKELSDVLDIVATHSHPLAFMREGFGL